jgi:hypothetical protein
MMAVKEERREGHSYIEPSWIASQICLKLADTVYRSRTAYCLCASFEDRCAVEVLVVFYGVTVLDDAFSTAIGWWSTTGCSISKFQYAGFSSMHTRLM